MLALLLLPSARVRYPFGKLKSENGKLKATDVTQLAHRYAHLFYARVSSSEWGLFGHIARSAFRRTPSGREVIAKPEGNLIY